MNNPSRWEADPTGRFRLRYWDGQQWTQYVSNGDGTTLHDPTPITTGIPQRSTGGARTSVGASPASTSTARSRPRLTLKSSKPAQQTHSQAPIADARTLKVPSPGQIGEVHSFGGVLRRVPAIVLRHDLSNDHLVLLTENGETREKNGRFTLAPASANPMKTRPGRLWWALRSLSHSFPTEAVDLIRTELTQLTEARNDETVAFGLEALPHGLDEAELLRLGVEPWRLAYERLRLAPSSARTSDREIRSVLTDSECPPSIRLALAIHTKAPPDHALRDFPALAAAVVGGADSGSVDARVVTTEASMLVDALRSAAISSAEQLRKVVESPEACGGARAAILGSLSGSPVSSLTVDTSIPLSVVDDLIDAGCSVNLTPGWEDRDRAYCVARQDPAALSDAEVIELDFSAEALRRARGGNLGAFGHVLSDDERFSVAISELAASGRSLDPESLASMGESASAKALSESLLSGHWAELPLSIVEAPGVGDLLLTLDLPDREPRSAIEAALMSRIAVRKARDALFEWDWNAAVQRGQLGLRWSTEETVRDELMNVVAAALWMRGKRTEALQLLRKALEGQYTIPLVCNTAAVAATLDTETALRELSRLAKESPDDVMRLVAAERAFIVWRSSVEEDDLEPPAVLLSALRSLLTLNVSDDRYRQVLKILAEHDSEWMAAQPPSAFGRRGASVEARVYRARARGFSEYISELASVHSAKPRPEWVEEEAAQLGGLLVAYLAENLGEQTAAQGVSMAMDVFSSGLPLAADMHVRLVTLVSASVAELVEDSEPKDEFIDWALAAKKRVREIEQEDRSELKKLLEASSNQLALAFLSHRENGVGELIETFNTFLGQAQDLGRVGQLNEQEFRKAMSAVAAAAGDHVKTVKRALSIVSDKKLKAAGQDLLDTAQEIQNRAKELAS